MDTAALLEQSVSKDQEVSRCDLCSDIHQRERREATYLPEKIEDIRTNGTTCPCCALISEGAYAVAKNCSAVFMDKDSFGGAYATEVSGRLVIAERRRGARTFSFYTLPETDKWPYNVQTSQHLSYSSDSPATFQMMRRWIADCDQDHSCYNMTQVPPLPKRVVDVGIDDSKISLYETIGENVKYACLSHCWGQHQIIRTTSSNIESHRKNIQWNLLSKTFQDAVKVTRELGIQYLWIDSLCIIQDSASDWEVQSSVMGEIYGGSYVTIAAAWSADGNGGCFSNREPFKTYIEVLLSSLKSEQIHSSVFIRERPLHDGWERPGRMITYRPLDTRAWCMQEFYLPSRIIKFDDYEVTFECTNWRRCECGDYDLEDIDIYLKGLARRPKSSSEELALKSKHYFRNLKETSASLQSLTWLEAVESFTAREITFDTDRLPAISAFAKRFQGPDMGRYLAGLWEKHLFQHLMWYPGNPYGGGKSHKNNNAPSWSWASIDGGSVFYRFDLQERSNSISEGDPHAYHASLLEAQCDPTGSDPFGRVSSGYIIVQGSLRETTLQDLRDQDHAFELLLDNVEGSFKPDIYDTRILFSDVTTVEGQTALFCLKVRSMDTYTQCLALQRCEGEEDLYRRVGYIKHTRWAGELLWWGRAREAKIKII